MCKYCVRILYWYFTRFPDGQRRGKQEGKKNGGGVPIWHTVANGDGRRAEIQCLNLSTSCRINHGLIGWEEGWGGGGREAIFGLVGWFCLLAGSLEVFVLSSSLPARHERATRRSWLAKRVCSLLRKEEKERKREVVGGLKTTCD